LHRWHGAQSLWHEKHCGVTVTRANQGKNLLGEQRQFLGRGFVDLLAVV